jgi:hypothetical protein
MLQIKEAQHFPTKYLLCSHVAESKLKANAFLSPIPVFPDHLPVEDNLIPTIL